LPSAQSSPPAPQEPSGTAFGAINTLRILLVGTIVVPLLLTLVGGYLTYRSAYREATAALAEAVAVAEENTTKVLDTHLLVAARIDDLLGGLADTQIRAQEHALHDRIAQQIANLPQVAAAWVIDSSGHELVSARVYPVNPDLDQSSREDFRSLRSGGTGALIWALRARSLDSGEYRPYFTVSYRRQGADGSFHGVVVVAVSGKYFASFYSALLDPSAHYTASVLRDDGTVLARYPEDPAPAAPAEGDEPLAKAIAAKTTGGVIATGSALGEAGSLVAYRRLASYPVYVTIGQTRAAILSEWLMTMAGYAAIGAPAAVGLMLLSLLALRRTRREQIALAQARDALAERAAIEAQLHHAQKMEAVGLLTAGMAHDFNNLLTIVAGNISMLDSECEAIDPGQRKYIDVALSSCDKAGALTTRLLNFASRKPVDPRPVDINEVVGRMSDLPWRSPSNRIAAEFRLDGALWTAFVDPNQLEDALLNLALNAQDAMAGRGTLTIETTNLEIEDRPSAHPGLVSGEYVAIYVTDTGPGMPEEVRAKAFDPFFTTKEAGKGTGLGLAQVYGFAARSGGHCAIDSELGQGTTVRLYLPRYRGPRGKTGNGKAEANMPKTGASAFS
jgi:signal transduction histidine kinase